MIKKNDAVLVCVLKSSQDLAILRRERWYRVPVASAPSRPFGYLAFYQPAASGSDGKCIRYYARVRDTRVMERRRLLPQEPRHPRARDRYLRIRVGTLIRLRHPVRNVAPRRVTFGYTTRTRLRASRDLLQIYRVAPIEQMVGDALHRAHIRAIPQQIVIVDGKRVRTDFTIPCRGGSIAVECDNIASHRTPTQRTRDTAKDAFLQRAGYVVLRLPEEDIMRDVAQCIARVRACIDHCVCRPRTQQYSATGASGVRRRYSACCTDRKAPRLVSGCLVSTGNCCAERADGSDALDVRFERPVFV